MPQKPGPRPFAERKRLNDKAWALYSGRLGGDRTGAIKQAIAIWTELHGANNWRVKDARSELVERAACNRAMNELAARLAAGTLESHRDYCNRCVAEMVSAYRKGDTRSQALHGHRFLKAWDRFALPKAWLRRTVATQVAAAHTLLQEYDKAERLWKEDVAWHESNGLDSGHSYLIALLQTSQVAAKQGKYATAWGAMLKGDAVVAELLQDDVFPTEIAPTEPLPLYRACFLHHLQWGLMKRDLHDLAGAVESFRLARDVYLGLKKAGHPADLAAKDLADLAIGLRSVVAATPVRDKESRLRLLGDSDALLEEAARQVAPVPGVGPRLHARIQLSLYENCQSRADAEGARKALLAGQPALSGLRKSEPLTFASYSLASQEASLQRGELGPAKVAVERARSVIEGTLGKRAAVLDTAQNIIYMQAFAEDREGLLATSKELLALRAEEADINSATLGDRQRLNQSSALANAVALYLGAAVDSKAAPATAFREVIAVKGWAAAWQAQLARARAPASLRGSLAELAELRRQLTELRYPAAVRADGPWHDKWTRRLVDLSIKKEALERVIAARYSGPSPPRLGPDDVTGCLPDGVAYVDYFWATRLRRRPKRAAGLPYPDDILDRSREIVAFVLRKGHPVKMVPLGATVEATSQASSRWLAELLRHAKSGPGERAAAQSLAALIWEPLLPHLVGVKGVIVCPEATLAGVPFAALPGTEGRKYLIHNHAAGVTWSARQFVESSQLKRGGGGLLAVGGVDYDAPQGGRKGLAFRPLPLSRVEAEDAAALFASRTGGVARPLLGPAASKTALLREFAEGARKWRCVLCSTHAFREAPLRWSVLPSAPGKQPKGDVNWVPTENWLASDMTLSYQSGLVLAGANRADGGWDGRGLLTAEEIMDLDFRGAELVILSACHGAGGATWVGEGVVGLQRAFHTAGARGVVAPMWKVEDGLARTLMSQFTRGLWETGLPPHEALRRAQLRFADGHEGADSDHPYYWAGYTCTGHMDEWQVQEKQEEHGPPPLEEGTKWPCMLAGGAFAVALIVGFFLLRMIPWNSRGGAAHEQNHHDSTSPLPR